MPWGKELSPVLVHLLDVLLCTLVLRVVLGWLVAYPRLLQLLGILVVLALSGLSVVFLDLPLAGILVMMLVLPVSIMLVLSFLPELVRIYHAAGRGNLFRPKFAQSEELVPDLADALEQMRASRHGALVVFPGREDAESQISGGEEVDARFNRSLLLSVFDPHCPRHDGAVVVRNDRIVRIGGVLPLASAEGAEAHLGTRHLAAIGLTERCDADVLVISEERGVISHAREGELRELRYDGVGGLEKELLRIVGSQRVEPRRVLKGRWSLGVWVVALGLSVVGSLEIRDVQKRMREREDQAPRVLKAVDATVQFANVAKNTFIDGNPAASVRLFLSVPESFQLAKIPAVVIDLASVPPGKVELKLSPDMVRDLSAGAVIERFEPSELVFRMETERRMEIEVAEPNPDALRLPAGLRLKTVDHRPRKVWAVVRDTSWKTSDPLRVLPVDLTALPGPGGYQVKGRLNVPASISVEGGDEVTLGVVLEKIP